MLIALFNTDYLPLLYLSVLFAQILCSVFCLTLHITGEAAKIYFVINHFLIIQLAFNVKYNNAPRRLQYHKVMLKMDERLTETQRDLINSDMQQWKANKGLVLEVCRAIVGILFITRSNYINY